MKSVLAVIKDFQTDSILLTKAVHFSPEKICVMVIRSQDDMDDEPQSEQISQFVAKLYASSEKQTQADLEIVFSDNMNDQDLADLLQRAAQNFAANIVMLMKPEISEKMEGLALVKALLRSDLKAKVCLCRQQKWASPLQLMCAVDIESENEAQQALDAAVLKYSGDVLKPALSADLHIASVIANSRISEELDLIEPFNVLAKKGKAIKEKLLAFESSNGFSDSTLHIAAGLPYREIPSIANKKKIDLVVLGNVGRTGIKGLIIGNTAEKIIRNLTADIVVINA